MSQYAYEHVQEPACTSQKSRLFFLSRISSVLKTNSYTTVNGQMRHLFAHSTCRALPHNCSLCVVEPALNKDTTDGNNDLLLLGNESTFSQGDTNLQIYSAKSTYCFWKQWFFNPKTITMENTWWDNNNSLVEDLDKTGLSSYLSLRCFKCYKSLDFLGIIIIKGALFMILKVFFPFPSHWEKDWGFARSYEKTVCSSYSYLFSEKQKWSTFLDLLMDFLIVQTKKPAIIYKKIGT